MLLFIIFCLTLGNGDDDSMLCFCCNRGLKDWESKDDPWTEHAIWSPSCKYLLLMKGKEFVEAIHGRFDCFGNKKQQVCIYLNN